MNLGKRMVMFLLAVTAAFVYVCNAIPQVKSESSGSAATAGMGPEAMVPAGKRIFMSDRAQCLTCHSVGEDPGARCPNVEGLGERAAKRKSGTDAAEYLVESLYNPNAFVVPGYPANQMTPVNRPPIALSHDEILAVIAYLNSLGGKSDAEFAGRVKALQEPWRKGLLKPEGAVEKAKLPILPGDAERGRALFTGPKGNCIQCHGAAGLEPKDKGAAPDLSAVGVSQSADYVLQSILDPNAVVVKGYAKTTVLWKEEFEDAYASEARGAALEWIPDQESPKKLRLKVIEKDRKKLAAPEEKVIDLSEVAYVGNAALAFKTPDDIIDVAGEYVSGGAKTGLTLRFLEGGRWVERRIPPEAIHTRPPPLLPSPMPADFADQLTPREVYDLIAFLMAQRGKP